MRSWSILISCLGVMCGLFLLVGCEGEDGALGLPGQPGSSGPAGVDSSALAPADRFFCVGLTNRDEVAAVGNKSIYLSFDSTLENSRDTLVASYVSTPPLIDGVDGEENEWGSQAHRIELEFMNPFYQNPNIYEVYCCAAYDERYIYMFFQWKEVEIKEKTEQGDDTTLVFASASDEYRMLSIDQLDSSFDFLRFSSDTIGEVIETTKYPIGGGLTITVIDTTPVVDESSWLVWQTTGVTEDRLAVMWGDESVTNWSDYAFDAVFPSNDVLPQLPSDLFVDIWVWGASKTNPVEMADDWVIANNQLVPDAGNAPYIDNWLLPDSIALYQNRMDPNLRTETNLMEPIYPLWYYDAVGFSSNGWADNVETFLPSIVTTIPTESRADVYAKGCFDNNTWVLEMKRARVTNSGDDVKF